MLPGPDPARDTESVAREQLVNDLQPLVVRTVRLIVGPGKAIAEDAAQEALAEIWRCLPSLRSTAAARTWATAIAARVAMRFAKQERRRAWLGFQACEVDGVLPGVLPLDQLVVRDAFLSLPSRQRAVAVLRLYVGLDENATAEALGCSVGTVKSHLHAARRALQRQLTVEDEAR